MWLLEGSTGLGPDVFQSVELNRSVGSAEFQSLAEHFAAQLLRYDFWDDVEMWRQLGSLAGELRDFDAAGFAGFAAKRQQTGAQTPLDPLRSRHLAELELDGLWRRLAVLPRLYEEVSREWFLPTPLGLLAS